MTHTIARKYLKKRSDFLSLKNGVLCVEGIPIKRIVNKYNTPLYLMLDRKIRENFRKFSGAFPYHKLRVQYATKCNSNLEILNVIREEGGEIDASSVGEIILALLADFEPHQITFTNLYKSEQDIHFAAQVGVYAITADSLEELKRIETVGKKLNKKVDIFLRINPLITINNYTTKNQQYGIPIQFVKKAIDYSIKSDYLNLIGFHFHGGYVTEYKAYFEVIKKMVSLMVYCKKMGVEIKSLDLGGGFPIEKDNGKKVYLPHDFGSELIDLLKEQIQKNDLIFPYLIFEPGKFIVANTMFGVIKVISKKQLPDKEILITDGSTYGFIPDALIYKAYYDIIPVTKIDKRATDNYTICGCTCDCIDIIGANRKLPHSEENDLLAVMDCGAYSNVMCSNFNTLKRAPMIMVYSDGRIKLIRRRDRYSEMFAPEMDVLKKYGDPDELKKYYNLFRVNLDRLWGSKNGKKESIQKKKKI
ncbi:MAG TPA: diaminopimelate decarboxylase [Candidatus Paceibacterota bacterium]|nr:diaminopimelate decarboxylase [Candidatus Paceibacterota bacterium]